MSLRVVCDHCGEGFRKVVGKCPACDGDVCRGCLDDSDPTHCGHHAGTGRPTPRSPYDHFAQRFEAPAR